MINPETEGRTFGETEQILWKGSDVRVGADIVIDKTSNVPVVIDREALPPMDELPVRILDGFSASTKSRLAQLGLGVSEGVGKQVADVVRARGHEDLSISTPFSAEVRVDNHCARKIALKRGQALFRYYNPRPRIVGKELVDRVLSQEISLEGKLGRDWDFIYENGYKKSTDTAIGVAVRIQSGSRFWIPPANGTPISAEEVQEAEDYRDVLTRYFEPIPTSSEQLLWIGETGNITLHHSIDAELERAVAPNLSAFGRPGQWGIQTNARLIDGGKTDWPVRVEVLSPTTPDRIPNYAIFYFMPGSSAIPSRVAPNV